MGQIDATDCTSFRMWRGRSSGIPITKCWGCHSCFFPGTGKDGCAGGVGKLCVYRKILVSIFQGMEREEKCSAPCGTKLDACVEMFADGAMSSA